MLSALRRPESTVLLIDEIDRSDHEFEAFLLEFLSDFSISIPERGTLRAAERPVVILTSNRTRDLHEALRRRCIYHYIAYPDPAREAAIIMLRSSAVAEQTAMAVVRAVGLLRQEPLTKPPGVAEAVDWAEAATALARTGAPWPDGLPAFHRRGGEGRGRPRLPTAETRFADRGGGGMSGHALPAASRPFVAFPALLRQHGFAVAPDQTITFLEAISVLAPVRWSRCGRRPGRHWPASAPARDF